MVPHSLSSYLTALPIVSLALKVCQISEDLLKAQRNPASLSRPSVEDAVIIQTEDFEGAHICILWSYVML